MKIITAPNQALRQQAKEITKVDDQLIKFISQFKKTLINHQDPRGLALAAPQVSKAWRLFAVDEAAQKDQPPKIKIYLNPTITKHSKKVTVGPDDKHYDLEGCLSIPNLYGPVPRWEWINLEYQMIDKDKLKNKKIKLAGFAARVAQHEFDHLNGVLFTDYSLEYDLPIYRGTSKDDQLIPIKDRSLLELY